MNPFYNPIFLLRIAKSYYSDLDRIWRVDYEKLQKYQDKALRKMVKYAYTVPLYRKKYKKHGVHPSDIRGRDDVEKLPFITKSDLREHFPNDIIPKGFDKENAYIVSTSGSTGKPVFIYLDKFSSIKGLIGFASVLKAYGGVWKKSKTALIMDTESGSIEHTIFTSSAVPFLKKFISLKNIRYLHIGKKPDKLLKELNEFNPEFLGSDPNMLRQLAFLKNNGYGKDVGPRRIFSGGAILDDYTKKYVEKAFNAKVLDTYGTTEGGPLAFECIYGNYHIHSDFIYSEFLDDENNPVPYNTPGHIVITKLYGGGTPIIRYTGIDDMVVPIKERCDCGLTTEMIKRIEGRSTDLIVLPNGKTLSPLTVTGLPAKTMEKFNSYKIKQFQIVQQSIDKVEVLIVIEEKQRNVGVPVKKLLEELQKRFSEKIGQGVNVTVKEVDKIDTTQPGSAISPPVVISKVTRK